jgi:hypothetical protein
MLMVIFGAGASYDSSPDFPSPPTQLLQREFWRPPLAYQLFLDKHGAFGEIVANPNYRRLLPILRRLRYPSSGSVEEELETLLAEASAEANSSSERKRPLFAVRYYLHDLLLKVSDEWLKHTSGVTNYAELLDQIQQLTAGQPVCLVTFNYDLLRDRALLSFDYKRTDPENEPLLAHPTFRLFKPHGSVDWARYVDVAPNTRLGIEQIIEQANTIKLTNTYIRADATHPSSIHTFERPIAPAIAVPVQTKTENSFEWPQSHRATLEQHLPSVTKILIIGWQAKEAHFLEMLRDKLPRAGRELEHILVVGKDADDSKAILHRFAAELGQSGYNTKHGYTNVGFSQFVASGELEAFLRA